jgi:branched-chain amino acid transport system substrate-binding protein
MKSKILIYALYLVILVGCHNKPKNTIQIGGLYALSGGAAAYGEDLRHGSELAVEEINSSNPNKLELIIKDTKSDQNEAVKGCEDLINLNNVTAIVGPTTSPNAIIVGRICDQFKVPLIVPAATQDEVISSPDYQRQFVTRICFNDSYQGSALADFAINYLKVSSAIIIFDKSLIV